MANAGTESRYCLMICIDGRQCHEAACAINMVCQYGGLTMRYWIENARSAMIAGMIAIACAGGFVQAQQVFLQHNIQFAGHALAGFGQQAPLQPVGTTCTIAAAASDFSGSCTATSTAGVVTFGQAYLVAPVCLVVDNTANAATNAYTVSTTAITLGTITSGHVYNWICIGRNGG
jgi:hypothetical protein